MSTQRFTVVVEIDAQNNTAQAFGELKMGMNSAGTSGKLLDGVMNAVGMNLVNFAKQLPRIAAETIELGAQVQSADLRFERFAGSTERAESLLNAFQTATDGTVDKMGAMSSAARLLQMGLVANEEEMGLVAEIATKLGNQTAGATDRISDFALLLANQSIPRLDNFGISSGKVRARIKELQAATKDMSREEAFKIAVMEEGRKSLNILGETSDTASVKIDQMKAAVKDVKDEMALMAAEAFNNTVEVDKLTVAIRNIPDAMREAQQAQRDFSASLGEAEAYLYGDTEAILRYDQAYQAHLRVQEAANVAFENAAFAERQLTERTTELTEAQELHFAAVRKVEAGISTYTSKSYIAEGATLAHKKSQSELEFAILSTIAALEEENRVAEDAAIKQTNLASSLFEATDAQIAATAIGELGRLLEDDKITVDEYKTAVTETQLAFGLADEKSIKLTEGLLGLTTSFGEGEIKATEFDDALQKMILSAGTGQTEVEELATLIEDLPDKKTVEIDVIINQKGQLPGGGGERRGGERMQHGGIAGGGMALVGEAGPELVALPRGAQVFNSTTTQNFTLNNYAPTPNNAMQDFELMRSLAA